MTDQTGSEGRRIEKDASVGGERARAAAIHDGEGAIDGADAAAHARALLLLAGSLHAAERFDDAESAARSGLDVLGNTYVNPHESVADDTEMKVLGADATSAPSERVTLLVRALESRLTMYAWRFEDRGLTFDPPLD